MTDGELMARGIVRRIFEDYFHDDLMMGMVSSEEIEQACVETCHAGDPDETMRLIREKIGRRWARVKEMDRVSGGMLLGAARQYCADPGRSNNR